MNLPAQFLALRERFIAGLSARLAGMRQQQEGLARGDHEATQAAWSELKRMAHSLVGAAGLHDLNELAEAAAALERIAGESNLTALEPALGELEQQALAQQTERPAPVVEPSRKQRLALLFQSDDEMAALATLLEGMGHPVSRFSSLEPLVAALRSDTPPALVLMGRQFDGDDLAGLQVLEQLKQEPGRRIPIVMLSSCRSIPDDLAAYRAGAARVLTKPLAPPTLARHVQDVLRSPGSTTIDALLLDQQDTLGCDWGASMESALMLGRHERIEGFFDTLDKKRPDLLLIASDQAEAETVALIRRVADHRHANHVPIVWLTRSADAAAHQPSSCWLVASADLPPDQLIQPLRGLHQQARRARQVIDDLERYRYENQRQSEALDRHNIISLADASGTIFASSDRHGALTGFKRTQIIGAHLSEARPGMAPPEFSSDTLAELEERECWQGEYRLPTAHGRPCWVDTTIVPFKDPDGQIYRYMVIRSDITERKLGEQALLAASRREIALAGQIQDSLLVPPMPSVLGGALLASRFQPADGVAGDFHALTELGPGLFDVLIGDVMGKGVPAALIGAACKMHYHQVMLDQLTRSSGRLPGLSDIMTGLQERLNPQLMELECFVTLTYARFDRAQGVITLIGCGHPPLLLVDSDRLETSSNNHPPLGLIIEDRFEESHLSWPPGSVAVLYSDGLSESESEDGEALGDPALHAIARAQCAARSAPWMISAGILDGVNHHSPLDPPADDRTLLVIRNPERHSRHLELPARLEALDALHQLLAGADLHPANHARRDDMVLATVETFTNLVKHARLETPRIQVSLWQPGPDVMEVTLCFDGPDQPLPEPPPLPDPEALSESGLGLALIARLCDSFEQEHKAGCNRQMLRFGLLDKPHAATQGRAE
ncbi:MAG: SpoIIE family protein phosphatase [Wenzhouxiangella sp.]